ncbi:hypothetical protein, partial [Streptococcus oralis]|uniref:hypothetical protein n=1 Tax=Streptococcus oralis TaxID=1303 RepID=UPI001C8C7DD1
GNIAFMVYYKGAIVSCFIEYGNIAFMVYYKGAIVSCFIEYYKQGEDYEKTHVFRNVTFRGIDHDRIGRMCRK